jgi:hypothetical protein
VQEALRMTPLGRQGDVRELKGAYLYLASDASSFCTGTDLRKSLGMVRRATTDNEPQSSMAATRCREERWQMRKGGTT